MSAETSASQMESEMKIIDCKKDSGPWIKLRVFEEKHGRVRIAIDWTENTTNSGCIELWT